MPDMTHIVHALQRGGKKMPVMPAVTFRPALSLVMVAMCVTGMFSPVVLADGVIFDADSLKAAGLDPSLATRFQHGATFPAGTNTVTLSVNGETRGQRAVRFDAKGQLCPDAGLLRQAGLKVPAGFSVDAGDDTCQTLEDIWPQSTVQADPGEGTLSLLVPQEALDPDAGATVWQHHGTAGLLNYNAQYMSSRGPGNSMRYWQLQTEAGFNAGDWVVRSNQSLYHFGESTETEHQNAYVQRTFAGLKSTLQAGQVPLSGGMFGVGQVIGFQMTPEQALYSNAGAAVVTGIADGPSVVEIRQLGVPVYHTTVPAGPFSLSGFRLLNTRTDLTVTVTGTDGQKSSFVVPASAYAREGTVVTPGLTWGMGRYDQKGAERNPVVGMVSGGVQLTERTGMQIGTLWSEAYQGAGLGVNTSVLWGTGVSFQSTLSRASSPARQGMLTSLSLTRSIGEQLTLSLNGSQQGTGYRDFSETLTRETDGESRNRNQYSAGLSWADSVLGGLSLSWGRSTQTLGDASTWTQLGWGRQFGPVSVSVNASRNQSAGRDGRREDRLYAQFRLPLGEKTSLSSTLNHTRDGVRFGSRVDQRLSQDRNWSLSVERDARSNRNSATGTANAVTRWSNLGATVSTDSDRSRSVSLQAGGSVVAHSNGVTASPYNVKDTFGIARVSDKAGIRVETPSGPVWTDSNGYAVIPSLNSWSTTQVQVDTRSLGRKADVVNGLQEVSPARGAVSELNFETISTRRALITARGPDGKKLTSGAAVYGTDAEFLTVVDDDGNLFLSDVKPGMSVSVESDSTSCRITLDTLPAQPADEKTLYETLTGVCR